MKTGTHSRTTCVPSSPVFAEDSISYAYASHTFHVTEIEDKTVALFVVQYKVRCPITPRPTSHSCCHALCRANRDEPPILIGFDSPHAPTPFDPCHTHTS